MKVAWTALAIFLALLVESALSQVAPAPARILDPFLLVLVYCGLTEGETHGMLAGAAAGWVQDVHFGGSIVGLSGLTKLLVGFAVGAAGARFMLTAAGPRLLVIAATVVAEAILFQRLAEVFDVRTQSLSLVGLLLRALVNAVVGVLLYETIDRRRRMEARG